MRLYPLDMFTVLQIFGEEMLNQSFSQTSFLLEFACMLFFFFFSIIIIFVNLHGVDSVCKFHSSENLWPCMCGCMHPFFFFFLGNCLLLLRLMV